MSQNSHSSRAIQDNDEIDLGRLYGILVDHKGTIASITAIFAIAGAGYALLTDPIYRADALVQIENASSTNPLSDVTSLLGQEPPSESEIEIIRSRMVLGRAVDILNLDLLVEPVRFPVIGDFLTRIGVERPDSFVTNLLSDVGLYQSNSATEGWKYTWAGETIDVKSMPVADAYLNETFTVKVRDESNYILSYEDRVLGEGKVGVSSDFLDGDISVLIGSINAPPGATYELTHIPRLMAINDLRKKLTINEQGQETGILNWGLTSPDPLLAEKTLATIADIYVSQNIQRQSQEARNSLNFLDSQVPAVRDELRRAEDSLNTYRTDKDSVDLSLETESILERLVNLESQLNELEFSEAEISRRFTPSHPTYAALLEKKRQLQSEREKLESQIKKLPETQQEVLRLQRDVAVNQQIYVQLRNKVQEMQIAEASTVGNVRILDEAKVLPNPVKPNKKLIVVLAALFGAMLAVGLVLLRAAFNRGVEAPDQLEQLGLPVYATVPLSEEQAKLNRRVKRTNGRAHSIATGLLAERNPADTSIEALRGLRTSLHFAMLEGNDNRLMITGPSPAIGKSFICVNLAAVCAQAGQRVLIIDGDMRKGHIHTVFGESSEGGLSEVLAGRIMLEDSIRPVESIENLYYLSRGVAPPNPSELLVTKTFKDLLEDASNQYDLVIVDSPPVLAVTDATIIGKNVGTSLLVARFQLNPPKEVKLAIRRLETGGVVVKGAVLNAMERKAATAYGYGYYNYSYAGLGMRK
ncbi:polysaccharide biosynthesis tyrosine autokinase [Halomonas sp. HP20-15]|uniref:polysaccharide biosynthesis tyrosine autokinase n=1 Tax=Halomonas sp. HP20-15 TaxID=3085901 RepID=UPI0029814BB5|nr:polysaccharide biosynthesis tyrosine autokinase [Halomonas sp. HP20-15]MDW5377035.1 polysaccharide biosynthesis tyrosine autokinase [Halomonas sp. HP20-15]